MKKGGGAEEGSESARIGTGGSKERRIKMTQHGAARAMKGGGAGKEGEKAWTGGKGDMAGMTAGGRKKTEKIVTEPVVKGMEGGGK